MTTRRVPLEYWPYVARYLNVYCPLAKVEWEQPDHDEFTTLKASEMSDKIAHAIIWTLDQVKTPKQQGD